AAPSRGPTCRTTTASTLTKLFKTARPWVPVFRETPRTHQRLSVQRPAHRELSGATVARQLLLDPGTMRTFPVQIHASTLVRAEHDGAAVRGPDRSLRTERSIL